MSVSVTVICCAFAMAAITRPARTFISASTRIAFWSSAVSWKRWPLRRADWAISCWVTSACFATRLGGTSIGFALQSSTTICSAMASSARWSSFCWIFFSTSARSAARSAKSPASFASSSSSAGSTRSFRSFSVMWNTPALPRTRAMGWLSGKVVSTSFFSPTERPTSASSIAFISVEEPISVSRSVAANSGTAAPSTSVERSSTATSPAFAARAGSGDFRTE